jgi:hypothetical protein
MKKNLFGAVMAISIAFFSFEGCNSIQSTLISNKTLASSPFGSDVNGNLENIQTEDVGEILNCSPDKIYLGETLKVSLKTPHGSYAAIRRIKGDRWFFLYGSKSNSPSWNDESFVNLSEINIETQTAYNSTNVFDNGKAEKIFNKTGKYRLMVSHEDFGQDDPPWTGMCEVNYINKRRPKKK